MFHSTPLEFPGFPTATWYMICNHSGRISTQQKLQLLYTGSSSRTEMSVRSKPAEQRSCQHPTAAFRGREVSPVHPKMQELVTRKRVLPGELILCQWQFHQPTWAWVEWITADTPMTCLAEECPVQCRWSPCTAWLNSLSKFRNLPFPSPTHTMLCDCPNSFGPLEVTTGLPLGSDSKQVLIHPVQKAYRCKKGAKASICK